MCIHQFLKMAYKTLGFTIMTLNSVLMAWTAF